MDQLAELIVNTARYYNAAEEWPEWTRTRFVSHGHWIGIRAWRLFIAPHL